MDEQKRTALLGALSQAIDEADTAIVQATVLQTQVLVHIEGHLNRIADTLCYPLVVVDGSK